MASAEELAARFLERRNGRRAAGSSPSGGRSAEELADEFLSRRRGGGSFAPIPYTPPEPKAPEMGALRHYGGAVAKGLLGGLADTAAGVARVSTAAPNYLLEKAGVDLDHEKWNLALRGALAAGEAIESGIPLDPAREGTFRTDLASGAGSMGAFVLTTLAGGALLKAAGAAPQLLSKANYAIPGLAGAAMGGEHGIEDAREVGADSGAQRRAWMWNAGLGLTEGVPIAHGLNRFGGKAASWLPVPVPKGRAGSIAAGMAEQGIEEAIQEGVQGFGENVGARTWFGGGYDPDRKLMEGVGRGMAVGGVLGVGFGGLGGAVGPSEPGSQAAPLGRRDFNRGLATGLDRQREPAAFAETVLRRPTVQELRDEDFDRMAQSGEYGGVGGGGGWAGGKQPGKVKTADIGEAGASGVLQAKEGAEETPVADLVEPTVPPRPPRGLPPLDRLTAQEMYRAAMHKYIDAKNKYDAAVTRQRGGGAGAGGVLPAEEQGAEAAAQNIDDDLAALGIGVSETAGSGPQAPVRPRELREVYGQLKQPIASMSTADLKKRVRNIRPFAKRKPSNYYRLYKMELDIRAKAAKAQKDLMSRARQEEIDLEAGSTGSTGLKAGDRVTRKKPFSSQEEDKNLTELERRGVTKKGNVHVKIVTHSSGEGFAVETTVDGDRRYPTEPAMSIDESRKFALDQLENPRPPTVLPTEDEGIAGVTDKTAAEISPPNAADIANRLKASGVGRQSSWNEWLKITSLKPGMDAKEWYSIYDSVAGIAESPTKKPAAAEEKKDGRVRSQEEIDLEAEINAGIERRASVREPVAPGSERAVAIEGALRKNVPSAKRVSDAGVILTDGWVGSAAGVHRKLGKAIEEVGTVDADDIWAAGVIRRTKAGSTVGVQISAAPTDQQAARIRADVGSHGGVYTIEARSPEHGVLSNQYAPGVKAETVVGDIAKFYESGAVPAGGQKFASVAARSEAIGKQVNQPDFLKKIAPLLPKGMLSRLTVRQTGAKLGLELSPSELAAYGGVAPTGTKYAEVEFTPDGRMIMTFGLGATTRDAWHETYHAIRKWALTDGERGILDKAFENEEAEAAAFADYMVGKGEVGRIAKFFAKMKRIIGRITGAAQKAGFDTAEDLFEGIRTGEVAELADNGVTPEMDAEYMAAVERGDTETAQRMVDEAAKRAGYNDEVWHNSPTPNITSFRPSVHGLQGSGVYVSTEPNSVYGKNEYHMYAKIDNPWKMSEKGAPYETTQSASNQAIWDQGYDAVSNDSRDGSKVFELVLPSPNQIKSADPITYDDAGNVIPLSQRFNPETPDIRASVRAPEMAMPEAGSGMVNVRTGEEADAPPRTKREMLKVAADWWNEKFVDRYHLARQFFGKLEKELGLEGGRRAVSQLLSTAMGVNRTIDSVVRNGIAKVNSGSLDEKNPPLYDGTQGGFWRSVYGYVDGLTREQIERAKEHVPKYMIAQRVVEIGRQLDQEARQESSKWRKKFKEGKITSKRLANKLERIDVARQSAKRAVTGEADAQKAAKGKTDVDFAREQLAEYDKLPEFKAILDKGAKAYRDWADALLDMMVDGGVITPQMRDKIKASNQYYVSFSRVMDSAWAEGANGGRVSAEGLLDNKKVIRQRKGSRLMIDDPYAALHTMTGDVVERVVKARVARGMCDLLTLAKGKDIDTGAEMRTSLKGLDRVAKKGYRKIIVDGVEKYWRFPPDIHNALERLDAENAADPAIWRAAAFLPQLLRKAVTLTPAFMIRNSIRDYVTTMILSNVGSKPTDVFKFGKPTDVNAMMFDQSGAGQFGHIQHARRGYYADLRRFIREEAGKDGVSVFSMDGLKSLGDALAKAGAAYGELASKSEQLNRNPLFAKSLEKHSQKIGREIVGEVYTAEDAFLDAAYDARDIMDFARAGTIMREINKIVPFSNAQVQALSKLVRRGAENPKEVGMRWMMYAVAPSLAVYALNAAGGEDHEEEYRQLPAYLRDYFWNIKLGGQWIRIPKPFELGVAASGVERAINAARGKEGAFDDYFTDGDGVRGILNGSVAKALLPLDETGIVGPLRGTVEALANYEFFYGAHIVPVYEEDKDLALREGNKRASPIGKLIEKIAGIDARLGDHLVRSHFAGLGKLAMDATSAATARGRERMTPQTWLNHIGIFAGSPVYISVDVQKSMELAKRLGKTNTSAVRGLNKRLKAYYEAKDVESRDAAAQATRAYAKKLRARLEALEGPTLERAQKGRG